jgi:hypothetical protein
MFFHHRDLSLQDPDVAAAALDHFPKHPKLGFSDCLILEAARKTGHLPLGTFDRSLGKRISGRRCCGSTRCRKVDGRCRSGWRIYSRPRPPVTLQ